LALLRSLPKALRRKRVPVPGLRGSLSTTCGRDRRARWTQRPSLLEAMERSYRAGTVRVFGVALGLGSAPKVLRALTMPFRVNMETGARLDAGTSRAGLRRSWARRPARSWPN